MRFVPALLALASCVWLTAGAQEPKPQPKPGDKAAKADKNEPVAGRKTKKIEGFTFLMSEEALNADASKYERPPLEVLEYECKLLIKMLSPKAVDLLRRLTVFVDWDEKVTLSNGRSGTALASYYGGGPQQMVKEGRHPLQAKAVTVHTLKSLTEQRQPKYDARTSCLLLHEFAHAVHDQLFGYDHAGIKSAYEQAMERKLYEKDFYAATNPREFFAELSCTYLDRLHYYPHNRDELKKHDPVTFKTMEALWSGATASKVAKAPPPHAEKGNLDLSLPTDVKFGPVISGPDVAADKLAGKVVLIGYWGGLHANVLDRLDRLQGDLGPYGLVVVCPNTIVREDDQIKADAEKRSARATVVKNAFVKEGSGTEFKSQLGGHALVFDSTGKCVHRGSAYDIEEPVRAAIGKLLLTTACGADEVPKAFKPVADAFAAGASPVSVISKLAPLTTSSDEDIKAKAKKLQELILAPGQKALTEAQASAKTDPVSAFMGAEKLVVSFKNTPVGTKATTLVSNLRIDKAVAAELKARTQAAEIEKLAGRLRGQEGSINPAEPAFQSKHQQALAQMKAMLDQLRKQHPNARATAEAEKAAREFSVP
ncbi:hypothetical protein J8F10_27320 [Gemmata sp. G18]|uniref:Uncharacterized protein n=1 Tax=Gemmata palustris TaxID=2822762 RepID=A0ABS5BZ21_9BACT|nr:hypothetical protein [Gemmata palustris]MBP3958971.1 hypothetical protein [Gemmata palustris]